MSLVGGLSSLLGLIRRTERSHSTAAREPVSHVILLDGTMSTLADGDETNVGLIYKLLDEAASGGRIGLFYEAGVQWTDWSATLDVIEGRGINRQIRRAYGWLASRYRPGDAIYLVGFSRGAYAVRSLAGVIGRVGLLRRECATERMVREAYRLYEGESDDSWLEAFRASHCYSTTQIEALAVFDTVKALGFRAPFVWKWAEVKHAFHDHHLGPHVRHGFHAIALHETREAFAPVLWTTPPGYEGHVEQVWFPGSHGDVGGQLNGKSTARPFSNIALVWMVEKLENCALPVPENWRDRFSMNVDAPQVGSRQGWGKFFLARKKREVGVDPSERLHPTALGAQDSTGLPLADLSLS